MQRRNFFSWVSFWILITCHQILISLGELVSISDCTCPGYELKLQCTVTGIGFIEWRGTAFSDYCTINLHISGFAPGLRVGSCNDGSIVGHWIGRHGENYTTQLTILVNSTMAGKTVQCVHNNLYDDVIIGNHMITLITDYPFKPPSNVRMVDVGLQMLTFNWSQPLNLSCDAIHYNVSATGCGECSDSISTSVTCTDITLSPNSSMLCSLSVQPVVCDHIFGNISNTASITLESPGTPSVKRLIPHYSSISKMLKKLEIEILTLDHNHSGIEILNTTTSYTINVYSDFNNSCASVGIPTSSCDTVGNGCIHMLDSLNKSCYNSVQISVIAFASGYFGNGLQSAPVFVDINNTLFDVQFDFKEGTVHCNFSEWFWFSQDNIKSCSFIYGPMQSFDNCNASLRNRNTSIENSTISDINQDLHHVIIHLTQDLVSTDDLVYCFIAKGTVMMKTIAIEGTFKWENRGKRISSAVDMQRIIIPVISCTVIVSLIAVIVVISGIIILSKRRKLYQSGRSIQQNIYMSCTEPRDELKHSWTTGGTIYADVQLSPSEVQTVTLDDDAVVYAEVNRKLTHNEKPAASQEQTCISIQSEDGCNQEHQQADNNIVMKLQVNDSLPNLDHLLAKLRSITHMWYQFGLAVGISQNVLDSYSEFPPDKRLAEVLNYWLTNHDSQLTWQDVTKTLNEMQFFHSYAAESTSDEYQLNWYSNNIILK